MTANELAHFWSKCDLEAPPYRHPEDCLARMLHEGGVFLRSDVLVHSAPSILGRGLGEDGLVGRFGAVETVAGERFGAAGA